MTGIAIRPARASDGAALDRIVLQTGDAGRDATRWYRDPRMLAYFYTAPYLRFAPESVFVAEDADGVGGYVLGCLDTRDWEAQLERDWWPDLRARYPAPRDGGRAGWSQDQSRAWDIHHPTPAPRGLVREFPAHMHMNLMPRMRGGGLGRTLFERWMEAVQRSGVRGVHIGANPANAGGIGFWNACGFRRHPASDAATVWMGLALV